MKNKTYYDNEGKAGKRIAELEAELVEKQKYILALERGVSAMDHAVAEARQQRDRLRVALEHASRNLCHGLDCDCEPNSIMYRAALSGTGEHPDTVRLRAVMEWLKECESAYREATFRPLADNEQTRINQAMGLIGITRDRLSADISRLMCQRLRDLIYALPGEVDRG